MDYLFLAAMWASGFVCGLVVTVGLVRAARVSSAEVDEADAHERIAWPVERNRQA